MTTPSDPAKVLTVCTGNICRSPAMEFYLERAWGDDAVVTSGGTIAATGWHIPDPMRVAEEAAGLTVPHHEPRQLDVDIIEAQDLILVAAISHAEWIERHVGARPAQHLPADGGRRARGGRAAPRRHVAVGPNQDGSRAAR